MRDLARLAIAAFGRQGEGSGVIGVDVQRIRRTLGLSAGTQQPPGEGEEEPPAIDRDQLDGFERHLRRELERDLIERTSTLPPSRPLADLDRSLPNSPTQDLAAVHRAVSQMKRRLATLGHEQRGRRRAQSVDVGGRCGRRWRPAACRCGSATAPSGRGARNLRPLRRLDLGHLGQRLLPLGPPRPPRLFPETAQLRLHRAISEVTEVFEHERDFRIVAERISSEGGVADVSGYTDYGRVWLELLAEISDDLDPRSTVIVLGDARTNGREPHAEVFGQVAERAGRLFWLNPEPKLYWNYGDSVMAAYEPYCDGAFECWTTRHLENFVNVVAGGIPAADSWALLLRHGESVGNAHTGAEVLDGEEGDRLNQIGLDQARAAGVGLGGHAVPGC